MARHEVKVSRGEAVRLLRNVVTARGNAQAATYIPQRLPDFIQAV